MKVQESNYIGQKKQLLKKLLACLQEDYPYVSVLAVDSTARTYGVSRRNMGVSEEDLLSARGFVVRVSDGEHYAEYSFDCLEEEGIGQICSRIRELVDASDEIMPEGMQENTYIALEEDKVTFSKSTEYEIDPQAMGDDEILNHLQKVRDKGLAVSDQILDCRVHCVYQKYSKLILSGAKELEQNVMWMTGAVSLAAARGEEILSGNGAYRGLSVYQHSGRKYPIGRIEDRTIPACSQVL